MIKAILHVEDLSVNVLGYEFEFKKTTDAQWQPYPGTRFEGLIVKIEGSQNNMWWEHAIADHRPLSKMTLEVQPAVLGQHKTTYHHFYDCHISSFKSRFSSESTAPFYELFLITCQGFESSTSVAVYQTKMRKTFDRNVTPVVRETAPTKRETEDNEPRLINQYITDQNDVELDNYNRGDKIFYVLESENMIGEIMDIELHNKEMDFLYRGERLKGDTIKNYIIRSDLEKIPLEVIPENYED